MNDKIFNIYLGFLAIFLIIITVVVVVRYQPDVNIKGMYSTQCDDIVRMNGKLVCEVTLQAEDDNIIILKEN